MKHTFVRIVTLLFFCSAIGLFLLYKSGKLNAEWLYLSKQHSSDRVNADTIPPKDSILPILPSSKSAPVPGWQKKSKSPVKTSRKDSLDSVIHMASGSKSGFVITPNEIDRDSIIRRIEKLLRDTGNKKKNY